MMIAAFDDDQEELIEMFDVGFFYFFCTLIAFLLYKYSIHYFAFLEVSVSEGRSVAFITKQFFRDFINFMQSSHSFGFFIWEKSLLIKNLKHSLQYE